MTTLACQIDPPSRLGLMSTVTEIKAAIERLSPPEIRELTEWVTDRVLCRETPVMLEALDQGIHSLESEPTISAEDMRNRIKAWTNG